MPWRHIGEARYSLAVDGDECNFMPYQFNPRQSTEPPLLTEEGIG